MSYLKKYMNKSDVLEKGISVFPSLYIEGAAASGKSTAVEMLLQNHPQQKVQVFFLKDELKQPENFMIKLAKIQEDIRKEAWWIVLEECPQILPKEVEKLIFDMIRNISNDSKVILVGREEIPEMFLTLLWKGKMERISQENFMFTRQEVRQLIEEGKSSLNAIDLYEVTGGWPGCVMLMLRLAEQKGKNISVQGLRNSYEIERYIQNEIIQTLSDEEMQILQKAKICPWINEEICEKVCEISGANDSLEKLQRKGILIYSEHKKNGRVSPLFANSRSICEEELSVEFLERAVQWYASHGCFQEMFDCLKKIKNPKVWKEVLQEHFSELPFLENFFPTLSEVIDIMEWKESIPELYYLRGMYCLHNDNVSGYDREITHLEKEMQIQKNLQGGEYNRYAQIYLNLRYSDERLTVDEWIKLVEYYLKKEDGCGKLSLYGGRKHKISCLSDIRELSDLFACSKKEENRKGCFWKEYLGENEWKMYQIARVEYYLETDQKELIPEENRDLFRSVLKRTEEFWLPIYFILCHLQYRENCDEEVMMGIKYLENKLVSEDSYYRKNAEAVAELKGLLLGEKGELFHWSQERENVLELEITKDNVVFYYCRAKGYIYLEQYERVQKILHKLILYYKKQRNVRFLSEVLFEQAIVLHALGQSGKALQSVIESFLVNGERHYVGFYTEYGQQGKIILEMYIDWLKKSSPEGWQRKKKYKYGNVVRMPQNDYIEYIFRKAKHRKKYGVEQLKSHRAESLTMMERIVLQSISLGMTNAEICEELNLKLPTVKSHIYNIYKKLGVKSRTQAILCGKEMKMKKK